MKKEINLAILQKRKWTIIIILLIAVSISAILSFTQEEVYQTRTSLELGRVGYKFIEPGRFTYESLENPEEIIEKIERNYYETQIKEDYLQIKAENPEGGNLLTLEIESSQTERAKNVLKEIKGIIIEEHQEVIDGKVAEIEKDLETIQETLDFLKHDKIYADQGIATLQIKALEIEKRLKDFKLTEVIEAITVSDYPISPRKGLNIIVSLIFGLIVGILFVIGKEQLKNN